MLTIVKLCSRAGVLCQGLSLRKASRFLNITSRPYTTRAQNIKEKLDLYVKPLAFTIVVCTGSFCLSYAWYQCGLYWAQRSVAVNKARAWWHRVTSYEKKIFYGILAANTIVYGMWWVPRMQRFMKLYFQAMPDKRPVISMLLSCFSHCEFWHLSINLFVLSTFMPIFINMVGREDAMPFYISAGVFSSLMSHYSALWRKQFIPSVGASGAIMGVLALVITRAPDSTVYCIFFPFVPIHAGWALGGVIALDLIGLIRGWKVFDHAAHLGGVLFAVLYDRVLREEVVKLNRMIKRLLSPPR